MNHLAPIKLPFDIVAFEVAKIFCSTKDIVLAFDKHLDMLYACGWTEEKFDKILLEQVNRNWYNRCST